MDPSIPPGDDFYELCNALSAAPLAACLRGGSDAELAQLLYRFALATLVGAHCDILAARRNPGLSAQGLLGWGQLTWSYFIFDALGASADAERVGQLLEEPWVRMQERGLVAARQRAYYDLARWMRTGVAGASLPRLAELLPLRERLSWEEPELVAAALAVHTEPIGDQLTHHPLYHAWPAPLYALARRASALELLPKQNEREILHLARRLNRSIGGFFRGQLLVALIVGIMVSIGLAIIQLPFWLLVGMVAGLFNIIPLIGPWVGGIPGVIIALTTVNTTDAIWVIVVMAAAQQIDNHFISPIVMQRAVKLHPAAVMMALLAGGTIGGFFGLLLAVPTAEVLKILLGHLWRTYVLGEPFELVAAQGEAEDTKPAVGVVETIGP